MREIKFRAWFHVNPVNYQYYKGKLLNPNQMFTDSWDGQCLLFAHEGQPVEIMQYIGLKDKNGQEIYDGDIIIFDNREIGGGRITGEVIFNTDQTLGNLEWGIFTKDGYHTTDFLGEIEVIGNIYENPNLLKEVS
jgi:uncharacterized phage protein (TIGR01671 family)